MGKSKAAPGRLLGVEGLASILARLAGRSPELSVDAVLEAVGDAVATEPQDDRTVLVIRRAAG